MSLRVSLYDFFSYTLPGIFFILITAVGLTAFGVINLDITVLDDLSLATLLVLVGAGYIIGLLFSPIADDWARLFIGGYYEASRLAFEEVHRRHPWLHLDFSFDDWTILLHAIKVKSIETGTDIEVHNAASIMLRSISLGLFISSVLFLLIYFLVYANLWNLVVAAIMLWLSSIAIKNSRLRRRWFYKGVFEAFAAFYLLEEKIKSPIMDGHSPKAPLSMENPLTVESADEKRPVHENEG